MQRFNKALRLIAFFTCFLASAPVFSQIGGSTNSLGSVNVDDLSDAQIQEYLNKAQSSGMSDEQLEKAALAKGMSKSQIEKLRARISNLKEPKKGNAKSENLSDQNNAALRHYNFGKENSEEAEPVDSIAKKYDEVLGALKKEIFGASIFSNKKLSFEPDLKMPTPQNYQLGPADELVIEVFGYSEANYKLKISAEGTIRIPNIGIIQVNGLTIEQASELIIKKLSQVYSGIREGNTQASISLGNIRSIKVTVLGNAVMPGTYTLPSLATIFNALYSAGGPNENGSMRNIQLVRNNKVLKTLDVYDFLMKGDQKNNVRLEDQDIIKINTYESRVSIFGEIKNPGYYEVISGETLNKVLEYAGGFTDNAYKAYVKVIKQSSKEKEFADVEQNNFSTYQPKNGDRFIVEPILKRYSNRVFLTGAVYREGPFELSQGLTLQQLLKKADGIRGDALLTRAYIKRLNEDLTTEIISFNLKDLLAGTTDIPLKKEDQVIIPSIHELKEPYTVSIEGEVLRPGTYPFSDNIRLEDLIINAGGLKEAASLKRIEVARRIKNQTDDSPKNLKAEIFQFDINSNLSKSTATGNFTLQPYDVVTVRKSPNYHIQEQVTVSGEALYPGKYTITSKEERISDILKRAGNITREAYPEGAVLIRVNKERNSIQKTKVLDRLTDISTKSKKDTSVIDTLSLNSRVDFVGIQLDKIMKRPGSHYDLLVEDGDELKIPKTLQTVKVSGEVLYPTRVNFEKHRRARYYISQAGSFSQIAKRSKVYVIRANGLIKTTRSFVFFNHYPSVYPGSEIIVPKKNEKKGLSTQETIGIASAASSLALVMITIAQLLKK